MKHIKKHNKFNWKFNEEEFDEAEFNINSLNKPLSNGKFPIYIKIDNFDKWKTMCKICTLHNIKWVGNIKLNNEQYTDFNIDKHKYININKYQYKLQLNLSKSNNNKSYY